MAKNSEKQGKVSAVDKLKKFFLGIYTELKLVVWPTKKTFQQSVVTVLVLCFISALLIFVVDTAMRLVLDITGFNEPVKKQSVVAQTKQEDKATESTVKVSETVKPETTTASVAATTK